MIGIERAIEHHNLIQSEINDAKGNPARKNFITKTKIATELWPDVEHPSQNMYNLIHVNKFIEKDHVNTICKMTGVDPNFLFGYSSKHDSKHKQLINGKDKRNRENTSRNSAGAKRPKKSV